MSGGSHNYLCFKDDADLFGYGVTEDLEHMATRLIELGHEDAAKETLDLKHIIQQAKAKSQVIKDRLAILWKAVEWYDSADSGIEAVEEAIETYRQAAGEREILLKQTLEQLEEEGLSSNRGTGAWRAGLRAKKALDEAYGKDRGA